MPRRTPEQEKQIIEIAAVIDFCTAQGENVSKAQVSQFFGVHPTTAWKWGFKKSYTPSRRGTTQQEAMLPTVLSASREMAPPAKREMPIRNGGKGRKRLKSIIDSMASDVESDKSSTPSTPVLSPVDSSPTLEEPRTPSNRRIAQPRKKLGARATDLGQKVADVEIKTEYFDEDVEV
jgi:hypothetical protein